MRGVVQQPTDEEVDAVIRSKHPDVVPILKALGADGGSSSLSEQEVKIAQSHVDTLRQHYRTQILRLREEEAMREVRRC
jgi:hypothetical protein